MIRRNGDGQDPAEAVGRVLTAKRAALLRAYRDRTLPDDLEDCLSQATLELVARARREALAGDRHSFVGLLRVCALSLIWEQRNPGDRLHRGTPSVALNLSGRRRTTPQRVTRWRAAPRRTHLRLSFEAKLADVGAQENGPPANETRLSNVAITGAFPQTYRLREAKRRLEEEHQVECRADADYEAYRARRGGHEA